MRVAVCRGADGRAEEFEITVSNECEVILFARGAPAPRLDSRALARLMGQKHVTITADLAAGRAADRVITCDLTRDYVTINADYHT